MISLIATPAKETPTNLLLACHERIRRFMKLAWKIADADGEDPDALRNSAQAVATYLTQALPLHMLDEHDSILPRLSGRTPDLDRALERMDREHVEEETAVAELVRLCRIIVEDPKRLDDIREELRLCTRHLTVRLESHLSGEEREIFPIVQTLDEETQAEIVREIRQRRLTQPIE